MAKLVDAPDLGSGSERSTGSIPAGRTFIVEHIYRSGILLHGENQLLPCSLREHELIVMFLSVLAVFFKFSHDGYEFFGLKIFR